MPWKSGLRHWTPQHGRWAVETPVLYEQAYLRPSGTSPIGDCFKQARAEQHAGVPGAPALCDLARWSEEAEEAPSDDGLDE